MDRKRVLMMNAAVIAAVFMLALAALFVSELLPQRQITPNAGVLGGFEPAVTTAAPAEE